MTLTGDTFTGNAAVDGGGGVVNFEGTATLMDNTFENNSVTFASGGGLANEGGTVTLSGDTFQGNTANNTSDGGASGGGIYNDGTATLTDVTFNANSAIHGGGLASDRMLTLTDDTFMDNSAPFGDGGGLDNEGGTAKSTDDTFASNSAVAGDGGGVDNAGGSAMLTLSGDTFSTNSASDGDGGGLDNNGGTVKLNTDIFANNTAGGGGFGGGLENDAGSATLTDVAFNENSAFSGNGAASKGLRPGRHGDLDRLRRHLHQSTPRETGLRRRSRQQRPARRCSVGRYLHQQLRSSGGFGGGLYNLGTAILSGGDRFDGNSAVTGGGLENDGGTVTLTGVAFSSNSAGDGGGLYNLATATLTGDRFTGNSATDGGGFDNAGGTATLSGDTFTGNSADDGGGLDNAGGTVKATGDTFTSNGLFAPGSDGGGLENDGGTATLTDETFMDNFTGSGGKGGGVYNLGSTAMLTLQGDTFTGNSADVGFGGGLDNSGGTATLTDDTFTGNTATEGRGGGLENDGGTTTLTGDTFTGNFVVLGGEGGGVDNMAGTVTLTDDTFTDNAAAFIGSSGGGLSNFGTATLTGDTFTGNSAASDGGLLNQGNLALYNTIVAGNVAASPGSSTVPSDILGTVTGTNNLIGDPNSAGGLTNGSDGNIVGIGGASPIPLSTIFATDASGVPVLASYGGPTQTVALVPGSPAIDAGSTSVPDYPSTDQRGLPRVGAPDIGAFESQGFQLTIAVGNNQTALVGQAFASPLVVTITANNPVEPVNGGAITFAAPAPSNSPSATLSASQATIAGGQCAVTATANFIAGSYQVSASVPESNQVLFDLTNDAFTTANVQAAIQAAPPGGLTLQPTTLTPLNVILTTLASLDPQPGTSQVTVSLPTTMSPYQAITVNLPAGLNFTLAGNGSSVSGNVTVRQTCGGDSAVNDLNVRGNLQIQLGNAENASAVVAQSTVTGEVVLQAGDGDDDSLAIRGLSASTAATILDPGRQRQGRRDRGRRADRGRGPRHSGGQRCRRFGGGHRDRRPDDHRRDHPGPTGGRGRRHRHGQRPGRRDVWRSSDPPDGRRGEHRRHRDPSRGP